MPIGNSYPRDVVIEDADLFLGTKASLNNTVNYTAQGIANYLNINGKVSITGQMSFKFVEVNNIAKTISFEGGGGNNTPFSSITQLIVSKSDLSGQQVEMFLAYLNGKEILLAHQNEINSFGNYKITGYTVTINPGFYTLDLEFIGGNGVIIKNSYYDMVAFSSSTGGTPYTLPVASLTILGGVKIGTGVNIAGDGVISVSTNYQTPLSGSGIVNSASGTISYISGTVAQYIAGDGSLITFPTIPSVTDYVPYIGATTTVDLGTQNIKTGTTYFYDYDNFGYVSLNGTKDRFNFINSAGTQIGYFSSNDFRMINGARYGNIQLDTLTSNRIYTLPDKTGTIALITDISLTSIGLTMPPAFHVANSPLTSNGTLAVTALGTAAQYIRGDGQLAAFPSTGGGGSSVNYYLNGSVASSVVGYQQLSNVAIIGGGTDFTITGNGLIQQFLTDAGNPNRIEIPGGAWNFEMWFSISSSGGNTKFYVELLKYDGSIFTTIASSSAVPEAITGGTTIDLYLTSLAVPTTTLLATDRLAIRVYIVDNSGGRTVTLHTEDNHLCEILTTFSGGVTSLNGLTANTQYLAVETAGTDFNISSLTDTHTFNLPTASATNRGALSSTDWSIFNSKLPTQAGTTTGVALTFVTDRVYGTIASPETGNITYSTTGALIGVTNIIIHNNTTAAPTFDANMKKLSGSSSYVVNTINYIYVTYMNATEVIYSINQRT